MNKAIFLDRDGTINVEKNYLYKIEDFEFLPGVIKALKQLQDAGYLLIIITNQSGIARGYYTEKDFQKLNNWMLSQLKAKGVEITDVFYCPHLPDATIIDYKRDCECRKPKTGMFKEAVEKYDLDLSKCFAIGDKIRDCAICENTECQGFLVGSNEKESIIQSVISGNYRNVGYASTLSGAANLILTVNR